MFCRGTKFQLNGISLQINFGNLWRTQLTQSLLRSYFAKGVPLYKFGKRIFEEDSNLFEYCFLINAKKSKAGITVKDDIEKSQYISMAAFLQQGFTSKVFF